MVNFNSDDYDKWTEYNSGTGSYLTREEFKLVCDLHARYKNHKYYEPCTCRPKQIKQWIKELNDIYDNGPKED